jgi:diaminopimelate epimerase
MGSPVFEPKNIPYISQMTDIEHLVEGQKMGVLSIGNPHAVIHIEDVHSNNINSIGTKIQGSNYFPDGVNVGFMQVVNSSEIYLRVIERGVGETLACGSGACAAVVHGVRLGLLDDKVKVHLTGGDALVEFDGHDTYLSGPAEFVYDGAVNLRTGKN